MAFATSTATASPMLQDVPEEAKDLPVYADTACCANDFSAKPVMHWTGVKGGFDHMSRNTRS